MFVIEKPNQREGASEQPPTRVDGIGDYWDDSACIKPTLVSEEAASSISIPKLIWLMFVHPSRVGPTLELKGLAGAAVICLLSVFATSAILVGVSASVFVKSILLLLPAAWMASVAALLLMPFIDVGRRFREAFLRSLVLMFWSGIYVVTVAGVIRLTWMVLDVMPSTVRQLDSGDEKYFVFAFWTVVLVAVGFVFWARWVVWLGACGLAHDTQTLRRAQCLKCGYWLRGLQISGRCPECGLEIQKSAPINGCAMPMDNARGMRAKCRAYIATFRAMIKPHEFLVGKHLSYPSHSAQEYAWWSWLLLSACFILPLVVAFGAQGIPSKEELLLALPVTFGVAAAVVAWQIAEISSGVVLTWLLFRRPLQPTVHAVCYSMGAGLLVIAGLSFLSAIAVVVLRPCGENFEFYGLFVWVLMLVVRAIFVCWRSMRAIYAVKHYG